MDVIHSDYPGWVFPIALTHCHCLQLEAFAQLSKHNAIATTGRLPGRYFREVWSGNCASGTLALPPVQGYLGALRLPSSSGPGRRPLTAKTGVRVPQGAPNPRLRPATKLLIPKASSVLVAL